MFGSDGAGVFTIRVLGVDLGVDCATGVCRTFLRGVAGRPFVETAVAVEEVEEVETYWSRTNRR